MNKKNKRLLLYFNIFIIFLVFVSVVILMLDWMYDLTTKQTLVLNVIDSFVVLMFIIDLVIEYKILKDKSKFLKYYWLDIIAVFPFFVMFRALKIVKIVRVVRIMRAERIFKIDEFLRMRHLFHFRKLKILHRATSNFVKTNKPKNKLEK